MKIGLEIGAGSAIRFRLRGGSVASFRLALAPYAGRRGAGRVMDVPREGAFAACAALSKYGAKLFADKSLQQVVRAGAWRCSAPGIYSYQRKGAEFLRTRRRAILADEMGLGKSAEALAAIDARRPAIIIAPPVVIGSWYDECRRWRPDLRAAVWRRPYGFVPAPGEVSIVSNSMLPMELVEPRTRCPFCGRCAVMETEGAAQGGAAQGAEGKPGGEFSQHSVESAESAAAEPMQRRWRNRCDRGRGGCGKLFDQREDAWVEHLWAGSRPGAPVQLVLDEAHYYKNPKARRTLFVRALASQCESTWLLTGTPMLNSPPELWALCQIFPGPGPFASGAHDAFGSWADFVRIFHGTKNKWGGYEWSAAGDVEPEAVPRLGSLMLRRLREEVLPELPKKTRRMLHVEVDTRGLPEWGSAEKLAAMSDDQVLSACAPEGSLSSVRKLLAERKMKAMTQLVEEHEETGTPLIVFSYHRGPIEQLGTRSGWAAITGSTPEADRSRMVRAFQGGALKGIAGTIGAMGVGVTLTHASNILFVDRDFVPAQNLQAEDRAARIGQLFAVLVTVLTTNHPVDLRVRDVLERKERLLESMQLGAGDVPTETRFAAGR